MSSLSTDLLQKFVVVCLAVFAISVGLFISDWEESFEAKEGYFVFRALPDDTKIYKSSKPYILENQGEDFIATAYTPALVDNLKDEREKVHLIYEAPGYEQTVETYTGQQYKALLQGEQHPQKDKPPIRLNVKSYGTVFVAKVKESPFLLIGALLALGGAWFFRKRHGSLLRLELLKELGEKAGGEDSKYVGKRISDYLLVKQLGKGGQSSTYKGVVFNRFGTKREEEGVVAIKILENPDDQERFEKEYKILRTLEHPNIVRVFEQGTTDPKEFGDSLCYMVMEFIDGKELEEITCRKTESGDDSYLVFKPEAVAKLLKPITAGLQHAHDKGVTHRDIKPLNIMLRKDEEAVLIDFGLSKTDQEKKIERVTKTGQIFGTPVYLSPEQFASTKDSGEATDQYALGVMIYHMLSGCLPHGNDSGMHFYNLQQKVPGKPLHEAAPDIPESICEVVDKIMHPEAAQRYEGVQAAYEAFEKALKP